MFSSTPWNLVRHGSSPLSIAVLCLATGIVPRRRTMSLHSGLNQSAQQTGRYQSAQQTGRYQARSATSTRNGLPWFTAVKVSARRQPSTQPDEFPLEHQCRICANNIVGRLNHEIRRKTKPMSPAHSPTTVTRSDNVRTTNYAHHIIEHMSSPSGHETRRRYPN